MHHLFARPFQTPNMAKRGDYGRNPYGNPAYVHGEPARGYQPTPNVSQAELHYAPKVDEYKEDKTVLWCKYLLFTYNLIIFVSIQYYLEINSMKMETIPFYH